MKPYFETELGKLYCGRCEDILPQLEENSIDCVLTDPPYGTNDGKGKVIRRGEADTDFSVLDWDKTLPINWYKHLTPIMKPDTWGLIFTDNKAVSTVWEALEQFGLFPRNTFYWFKTNKAPTPRCNFKSCIETAVVFTKGRTNQSWYGGGNQNNIISLPFCSEGLHPTQKPVKLLAHLIPLFTQQGDTVLDPFFGSGTTGVACELLGRRWIGIEIDEEYCEIAANRIEKASKQHQLFDGVKDNDRL